MKLPDIAQDTAVLALVDAALAEDIGAGDVTTTPLVSSDLSANARILARQPCVVSGVPVAAAVFSKVDPDIVCKALAGEGHEVAAGEPLVQLSGSARGILAGERTALNFMQRMCGVATLTHAFVIRAAPHECAILDTRKTTPGLRRLEKYAVLCGGGRNHRMGLFDMALIKDNHRRLWRRNGGDDSLAAAVARVREKSPDIAIEIEVETEAELRDALAGNPDWILLDNMEPNRMADCVAICGGRCKLEASGGITLDTIADVAAGGVDAISLGCLTHSAPSVDLSLEFDGE